MDSVIIMRPFQLELFYDSMSSMNITMMMLIGMLLMMLIHYLAVVDERQQDFVFQSTIKYLKVEKHIHCQADYLNSENSRII